MSRIGVGLRGDLVFPGACEHWWPEWPFPRVSLYDLRRQRGERTLLLPEPRCSRNGIYGTSAGHSALMLAARITLPHFSVSSAMSLPNSAGVIGVGSTPTSASRAFSFLSARPALTSLLSLSTMSAGVLLGAPTPYHPVAS